MPNTPIFNVPTDPHVAQKNLSLVKYKKGLFHFSFEIHNAARTIRSFNIFAEEGKLEQLDKIDQLIGKNFKIQKKRGNIQKIGFTESLCPEIEDLENSQQDIRDLKLQQYERKGYTLIGKTDGGSNLIHINQTIDNVSIGGLSILVMRDEEQYT